MSIFDLVIDRKTIREWEWELSQFDRQLMMVASTGPLDDQPRKKSPEIERKREWEHGDRGQGKDCWRAARPVFTPPEKTPDECHGCSNDEWYSKGVVRRNKETKQIIDRERDRDGSGR